MNMKTVKLTKVRLIGSNHLPVGSIVTLDEKRANDLVKARSAVHHTFDEHALPPPPAKRQMLPTSVETATARPGPKRAARVVAGDAA